MIKWFMSKLCKWYNGKSTKELSYFEKFWPELLRVFILFNYFYFTYFLFSLLWNFMSRSVLREKLCNGIESSEEPGCIKSSQKHQYFGKRIGESTGRSLEKEPQCKILNSLQKLKEYNESFQSFWRNQLDFFYTNLLNVYFLCSNKNGTNEVSLRPYNGKRGYKEAVSKDMRLNKVSLLKRNFEKQNEYDKCLFYSAYNAQIRNEKTPFCSRNTEIAKDIDAGSMKIKSNKDGFDTDQNFNSKHARDYSVNKEQCSDCYKIRIKKCKHNLIKHQTDIGKRSDESCKVIFYGPYASSRKTDVNKNKQESKENTFKKCIQKIPDKKRKLQKDRKISIETIKTSSKHESQSQSTAMTDKQKKKTSPKKEEVKIQYFSEDDPALPATSSKTCSGVTIPGVPLSMIDPNDNFMTNSSVKYVYKKNPNRNGMNHTLVDVVTNVIRGVSKSIKRDRHCSLKLGRLLK